MQCCFKEQVLATIQVAHRVQYTFPERVDTPWVDACKVRLMHAWLYIGVWRMFHKVCQPFPLSPFHPLRHSSGGIVTFRRHRQQINKQKNMWENKKKYQNNKSTAQHIVNSKGAECSNFRLENMYINFRSDPVGSGRIWSNPGTIGECMRWKSKHARKKVGLC